MKVHERTLVVQRVEAEIGSALWKLPVLAELTPLELAAILCRLSGQAIRMGLRQERHPDDPEKKADEA